MKKLAQFKAREQHNRTMENQSEKHFAQKRISPEQRKQDVRRFEEEQGAIRVEMSVELDVSIYVCNKTVSFQAIDPELGANPNLGDNLQVQFPVGFDNSEIGQGLFHIHELMVPAVLKFLEDKVFGVKVYDTDGLVIGGYPKRRRE